MSPQKYERDESRSATVPGEWSGFSFERLLEKIGTVTFHVTKPKHGGETLPSVGCLRLDTLARTALYIQLEW